MVRANRGPGIAEILNFQGIRRVSATDKYVFSDWMIDILYPYDSVPADATEAAFGWFQQRKVECPADKELDRPVRSSFQQFELHLDQHCADSLHTDNKMLLEVSLNNDTDGVSFGDLVNNLKSLSSRLLRQQNTHLWMQSKTGLLWSRSCFACSAGDATKESLKAYVLSRNTPSKLSNFVGSVYIGRGFTAVLAKRKGSRVKIGVDFIRPRATRNRFVPTVQNKPLAHFHH